MRVVAAATAAAAPMNIRVQRSAMVRPSEPTPQRRLWNSNLDLVVMRWHTPSVYFYRRARILNNFIEEAAAMEAALARALVPFYPLAGRLARDDDGRIQIDCNAEGALFVVAEADGTVDDFGDFTPTPEMKRLIPSVEYSDDDVSSFPLLVHQVTYFKCGGVALGVGMEHHVTDGYTGINFINSWANLARGLPPTIRPFIDRTLLRARDPPTPSFSHIEYHPPPSMSTEVISPSRASDKATAAVVRMFKFSQTHTDKLRAKVPPGSPKFSSYVLIAGHVWRCACLARGLPADQLTKLYIATDGRQRLKPPLPDGYIGNVIFTATPIAAAGEVTAGVAEAAAKVQGALARMDDEYMKSALDYLELQPDLSALAKGPHTYRCPNLALTSWARLPMYEADFGWGRPAFVGPGSMACEGHAFVLPSPAGDGSHWIPISLQAEHMDEFGKLIYQI